MDENLIIKASQSIEAKSIAKKELEKDPHETFEWCFANLHKFTHVKSRKYALDTIFQFIDRRVSDIPISAYDPLLQEFFGMIFTDPNYSDATLFNKVIGIQARLAVLFYDQYFDTIFDVNEKSSIVLAPEKIFYCFIHLFGQVISMNEGNKKLLMKMYHDNSLANILQRISNDVVEGNIDAKKAFLECFDWIDFHFLIRVPCCRLFFEEFKTMPNPTEAMKILSNIFQSPILTDENERLALISYLDLLDYFTVYFETFKVIEQSQILGFSRMFIIIFDCLKSNPFILNFMPIIVALFYHTDFLNRGLNGMIQQMCENELIEKNAVFQMVHPNILRHIESPTQHSGNALANCFDLLFRDEEEGNLEKLGIFIDGYNVKTNPTKTYLFLNGFYYFIKNNTNNLSKHLSVAILTYFSYVVDFEIVNDIFYISSLKSYSSIVLLNKKNLRKKVFSEILSRVKIVFLREFQCTLNGSDAFIKDLLKLVKIENANIIFLPQICEIVTFLIECLNKDLFDIALILLKKLEVSGKMELGSDIRKKTIINIVSRNPEELNLPQINAIFSIFSEFSKNGNQKDNTKNRQINNQQINVPNQLINIPNQQINIPNQQINIPNQQINIPNQQINIPNQQINIPNQQTNPIINDQNCNIFTNDKHMFDFFAALYPKIESNGSKNNILEYVTLVMKLFGFKSFPIYNEVISHDHNSIELAISMASALSSFLPKISSIDESVVETVNILVKDANISIVNLQQLTNSNNDNTDEDPSEFVIKLFTFFHEFTKFMIPTIISNAPQEVFSQIMKIYEMLFKVPIMSDESLKRFFKFVLDRNEDFQLFEMVYPDSVRLLTQCFFQPKCYPTNYRKCMLCILDFHNKLFMKDEEWGKVVFEKERRAFQTSTIKFKEYMSCVSEESDELFLSLSYKIVDKFINQSLII